MGFRQRLKTDKGFRNKIIILFIIMVIIVGNIKDDKKTARTDAECRAIGGGTPFSGADVNACVSGGCYPVTPSEGNILGDVAQCTAFVFSGIFHKAELTFVTDCVAQIPNNVNYISDKDNTIDACTSGFGVKIGSFWCGGDIYNCRFSPDPPEKVKCSSDLQRQVGSILDSVWEENPLTCKTSFYTVAIIGGFLVMMLLIAAL